MIIEATVTYNEINCSVERYIVSEPMDMMAGKEWRVFRCCTSKDDAKAVLRTAKSEFPDKEFKIVLIKWKCSEVKL